MTFSQKLTDLSYMFDPTPGSVFNYYIHLLIFFMVIFAIGSIMNRYIKKDKICKKILKKSPRHLYILSLLGLIFLGSRQQNIPFLSIRAWMLLLIIGIFIYIGRIIHIYFKKYPQEKNKQANIHHKNKYLPVCKRKKGKKRKNK